MTEPDETHALLYTPQEVADRLRIGKSNAYKLIASGEIPSVRLGTLIRVRSRDLNAYVDAL